MKDLLIQQVHKVLPSESKKSKYVTKEMFDEMKKKAIMFF